MIFTAQRKELLAQVKRVSKATPRKSMLPILSGIHVEVVPELAALRLMATDFEVAIRTSIRAKVKSGGEFVMDARLLTGLLGKLSGDEVTMELQANNSVRVRSGNADFVLGVLNGAEFPRIEIPTPNATVMVTGIPSLIGATAFAASKEAPGQAARPQLSCVNLIIGDNGIRAVATNGISLAETRGDPDCVGNFSMMLTATALNTLASLAGEDLISRYTTMRLLTPFFPMLFLNTNGESKDACVFLKDCKCSVQDAKPRTCRMFPLSSQPGATGIEYLWVSKEHHPYSAGDMRVDDWMRDCMNAEDREFLRLEHDFMRDASGYLLKTHERRYDDVLKLLLAFRYFAYDPNESFIPQYEHNASALLAMLKRVAGA